MVGMRNSERCSAGVHRKLIDLTQEIICDYSRKFFLGDSTVTINFGSVLPVPICEMEG